MHKEGCNQKEMASGKSAITMQEIHVMPVVSIFVEGKATWVKPRYTKIWTHILPNGRKLKVKAGTQIIDRFWGHLRTYLKHAARKVGSSTLTRKIKAAQWTYWYGRQHAWMATASMLKDLRSR